MTEIKIYCDHCGKELDPVKDYADTELCVYHCVYADLCLECVQELDNIVFRFIKKGSEEE